MTWREELSWAAGVIDGEGCFKVIQNIKKNTVKKVVYS